MFQNGACYIRVSTDEQTEYSPDAQLKALKKYAKTNNIILTKEYIFVDEGISGKRADKRPEFMRMIATAKSKPKPFDVILVHKFDRFARSREDSVVYKSLLKKEAGIKVVSITESIEDDKFSVILEAMLEAMAEYYSLNLADEVKKGMTEKAERGEYQTVPPFGYDIKDKKLFIIPDEAEIIKYIFEKFTNEDKSMRELAIYVNALGFKSHRGNSFENRSIDYILNNPVYIGKVRWTPSEKAKRNFSHPDSIIKDGEHEPIIDIETWNKAQEIIKNNKVKYKKYERINSNPKSWISGIVKCGNCGRSLVINSNAFKCNAYLKGQCKHPNTIGVSVMENLVLEQLSQTYQGKIEINYAPKVVSSKPQNERELIEYSIEKLVEKEKRIKIAYEDGIDTIEEYKENKTRISSERENLIKQLKALREDVLSKSEDKEFHQTIESVYHLLKDDNIAMQNKYEAIHFLIDRITYARDEKILKITYK